MTRPLLLANALLRNGARADILIVDGRISASHDRAFADDVERIDLDGALLIPGLVDGHIHLDKTLLGMPFQPHIPGESVAERIAAEKALRRTLTVPVEVRATALVKQAAAFGTTAMRSHVDIDNEVKLDGLHAILRVREAMRDLVDIQIVAFPQSGVVSHPGAADLLDQAIREGADVVGGLDPGGIDGDVKGQLDAIFAIAERHGVGLDIHLHDPGELGCSELREIAARTNALGMEGKVAVSHAYALGGVDDAEFARTAEVLARSFVSIMTNGAGPATMPPVKRLISAGVRVFLGSDNIRDAWSPYGNGDMLDRAAFVGYRNGLNGDDELRLALELATTNAAAVLGLAHYAMLSGAPADLVAIPAHSVPEAVAAHPQRKLVIKRGRVIACDGRLV